MRLASLAISFWLMPAIGGAQIGTGHLLAPWDENESNQMGRGGRTYPGSEVVDEVESDDASAEPGDVEAQRDALRGDELAFSKEEVRRQFNYGVSLNLGVSAPWQVFGADFQFDRHAWYGWTLSAGGGVAALMGHQDGAEYRVDVVSRALQFGWRYYLHREWPLYLQPAIGSVYWTGNINPSGLDEVTVLNRDRSDLQTGFGAYGATVSLTLGGVFLWESGFFLDYGLVGLAKTFIIVADSSADSAVTDRVMQEHLGKTLAWGLANIKIGWRF